jgi:hypothetical protein
MKRWHLIHSTPFRWRSRHWRVYADQPSPATRRATSIPISITFECRRGILPRYVRIARWLPSIRAWDKNFFDPKSGCNIWRLYPPEVMDAVMEWLGEPTTQPLS